MFPSWIRSPFGPNASETTVTGRCQIWMREKRDPSGTVTISRPTVAAQSRTPRSPHVDRDHVVTSVLLPKVCDVGRRDMRGRAAKACSHVVGDCGDFGVGIRTAEAWHIRVWSTRLPGTAKDHLNDVVGARIVYGPDARELGLCDDRSRTGPGVAGDAIPLKNALADCIID